MRAPLLTYPEGLRQNVPLACQVVATGLLLALVVSGNQASDDTASLVAQARSVERSGQALRELRLAIQGAESSQRGFILTGEERYLKLYRAHVESSVSSLGRTRSAVLRDDELARVEALHRDVPLELAALERILIVAKAGGASAVAALLRTDPTRELMDRIANQVTDWEAEHIRVLDARRERVMQSAKARDCLGTGVLAVGLSLLLVAGVTTFKNRSRPCIARSEAADAWSAQGRSHTEGARHADAFTRATKEVAYRYDCALRRILWQSDTSKVLGEDLSRTAMSLSDWHARIHPDDLQSVLAARDQRPRSEGVFEVRFRLRQADGAWRWVEQRGVVLRDQHGLGVETVGVILDVTDTVTAGHDRATITRQFDALLGSIRDGFLAVDDTWTYVYVNETAARILGKGRDEMVGHVMWEVFPTARGLPFDHASQRVKATGDPVILEQYFALTSRWYRNHIYPFGTGLSIFLEDVTDRKDIERQRDDARHRLAHFVQSLDRTVEAERTEIAREIHDELGQALTGLKYDLAWVQRRLAGADVPAAAPILDHLASMSQHIDETVNRARRLARELRPAMLTDLGLAAALRAHAAEWSKRSSLPCECVTDVGRLPANVETALYRIAVEACTNVLRHAQAHRAWLHLQARAGTVELEIGDDGIGFDPAEATKRGTLGLLGITERALLAGGEARIDTSPGRGTRVRVRIPADALPTSAQDESR